MEPGQTPKLSSLRWQILRRALRQRPSSAPDNQCDGFRLESISRRARYGFDLIPWHVVGEGRGVSDSFSDREACLCYTLPLPNSPMLFLRQRWEASVDLHDFEVCNQYDIDNTGLVCQWPSEEILAYYSMSHLSSFRGKKIIELGSGYGLAGLVIAMATEASEVVISDGNPQVVDYIQRNIDANSASFNGTTVKSMILHWDQHEIADMVGTFDVIVASDCTFFKKFHKSLAQIIKHLLKENGPAKAILFNPKRGDSLDMFLAAVKDTGLQFNLNETYDMEVWKRHMKFISGDPSWPNYEPDHCYPLLISITR
ncbi:calmodulin-lysine N-methyltransferase [Andrographis paniculata]|uniref:calmodulin-lysine N-methyltransferase n=1 Tax=Andrographis paniculata TaxID=175694 RepID=UPI0021E7A90A|nr:calmodulin-lysine N-methyltransferase [Andrographis paniculata]XP_051117427.1 calmodulin-lysine N-methyltransferase [Andrographis paniculata]XP_051117428.1 calmodulin-lysine N-methyltransferase [Andrographis paniculata]